MCQTPKQKQKINYKSVIFLCLHFPVKSCDILLLSNFLDFVPCDLRLQRAQLHGDILDSKLWNIRDLVVLPCKEHYQYVMLTLFRQYFS